MKLFVEMFETVIVAGGQFVRSEDFIPAPASPAPPTSGLPSGLPTIPIQVTQVGLDTTKLIIGIVIVLVMALILYFVRGGIKSALVSSKASLDAANFAASSWFVYLLSLIALIVFGLLGGFFGLLVYSISTGSLALVGLIGCLILSANARSTRK